MQGKKKKKRRRSIEKFNDFQCLKYSRAIKVKEVIGEMVIIIIIIIIMMIIIINKNLINSNSITVRLIYIQKSVTVYVINWIYISLTKWSESKEEESTCKTHIWYTAVYFTYRKFSTSTAIKKVLLVWLDTLPVFIIVQN